MIYLTDFSYSSENNTYLLSCKVANAGPCDELYYRCTANGLAPKEPPTSAWAVLGLLYPAMASGQDIRCDKPIGEDLLFALNGDIQALLCAYDARLKRITIDAPVADHSKATTPDGCATGFSAGVDTFTTLKMYSGDDAPGCLRLNTLTTFNVGAMGSPDRSQPLFQDYSERLAEFSQREGYNWLTADSNLGVFYQGASLCGFQKTHVLRNISAAYAFEAVLGSYLYSSSYPFSDINRSNDDMAFIEPLLLPLVSTQNLRCISAGAGFSRLGKMAYIHDYKPAQAYLDVCVEIPEKRVGAAYRNCSRCWKCARALVTLDALGSCDHYGAVFNLNTYKSNKKHAWERVVASALEGKPADIDTLSFLDERGMRFGSYPVAAMKARLKGLIRKMPVLHRSAVALKSWRKQKS